MATDPYLYPGTNTLKNLAGVTDSDELQHIEAVFTSYRSSQLLRVPLQGNFDVRHLRDLHQHIFQDLYEWAGTFRTVNIGKQGEFWFCRPEFILQALTDLFAALSQESNLIGTSIKQFCSRTAYYLGELNAVHPFREGNGRTQREFVRELGVRAGFHVDWRIATQEEIYSISISSFRQGNNKPAEELLRKITTVLPPKQVTLPDPQRH
jgi:cell filamentation protein, protein adenylyltransferase